MKNDRDERDNAFSIGLHWLIVWLVLATYASIELRAYFPKGSAIRAALKSSHFTLGISVFGVACLALVARRFSRRPPILPEPPSWQAPLAKLVRAALYACLVGLPLGGWLAMSAAGEPLAFFGLRAPALVGPDEELASSAKELHEAIGAAAYYLIGAHVAAAVFHHCIRRDNALLRMLPRRNRRGFGGSARGARGRSPRVG